MGALSNNEVKFLKSLQLKKFRDQYGLFTVEGDKMVEEALASGFDVVDIYRREDIGEDMMKKISSLSSPSPVLATVRKPTDAKLQTTSGISLYDKGLYLGLASIRDPGNLGTILRIADWFGIDAVFATSDTVDVFNPKTVQATMGAIFRVKYHSCLLPSVAEDFLSRGGKVYGTFLDGLNIYSRELCTGGESPVMIVIGNESEGIGDAMERIVSDKLFIPPFPESRRGSESLNAAVATAVTIAEFRRRTNI